MSLIVDYYDNGELRKGLNADDLWSIFYHFMVSDATLTIVHTQSEKLLAASHSFDSWKTSRYGRYIQFVSEETYCEVSSYWRKYADIADPTRQSTPETQEKYRQIRQRIQKIHDDCLTRFGKEFSEASENAGPFILERMGTASHAMRDYWRAGVLGGSDATSRFLGKNGEGLPNPLFTFALHSFHGWDCHYATDPLKGFYLAESLQKHRNDSKKAEAGKLAESARAQFFTWVRSFSRYVDDNRVVVRFWSAEALAACFALQARLNAGSVTDFVLPYARPWSAAPMHVDASMHKGRFNVVESSNVVDYLGLLNVLAACRPLLLETPDAALFSETLLRATEDDTPMMLGLALAEIREIGILLNLLPLGHLTGVLTTSNLSVAAIQSAKSNAYNGRVQITWKVPALGDTLEAKDQNQQPTYVAPDQLAIILYSIYAKMFEDEDPAVYMQKRIRAQSGKVSNMSHYSKASIVGLILTVKLIISTDWKIMMDSFLQRIWTDKTRLLGSNSFQELGILCQLARLSNLEELRVSPRHGNLSSSGRLRAKSNTGFLTEKTLPAIGFISLVVPRTSIAKLTAIEGTPVLQARVRQIKGPLQQQYDNMFSTIQGMFGKLDEARCNHDRCVMRESEKSWNGTSDLIVCFRVPILSLLLGPEDGIRIALHLNQTNLGSLMYKQALGSELCVFEAGLDSPRVKITRNHTVRVTDVNQSFQPDVNMVSDLQNLHLAKDLAHVTQVSASMHSSDGTKLQYHLDVSKDIKAGEALAAGNQVSVVDGSPCTINLSFGNNCSRRIAFLMPISRVNSKIRIARKSQWVEVSAAVSLAGDADGYSTTPFPIIVDLSSPQPSLTPWSLPYVPLDKCSKVPLEPSMDLSWINHFFALCRSDAEHGTPENALSPMVHLKDSIKAIFSNAMGMNDKKKGVFHTKFALAEGGNSGGNTLIIVDAIRHDPTTQCIVLDAYVVPLTVARVQKYNNALADWMESSEPVASVLSEPSETRLWKHFIPACAERCRTYPHKITCEYKADGVPRSLQVDKPAICSCGEGKVSASFMANQMHAPFAKVATRVAIPPLFPVPYVEECFRILKAGSKFLPQVKGAAEHVTGSEKCFECGKNGADAGTELKKCAKCRKVAYCGRACQVKSWPTHKKSCKA